MTEKFDHHCRHRLKWGSVSKREGEENPSIKTCSIKTGK